MRLTAAEATYAKVVLGKNLHAKTAKVEHTIETFETRPDDRPDHRSEEEKMRDASNNWMRWRGYLGCLPNQQKSLILEIAHQEVKLINMDATLTKKGKAFIDAIKALEVVVSAKWSIS